MTYAAPLGQGILRLSVFDVDADTGLRSIKDIKEQDVYMGEIPLMTDNGTFVVNDRARNCCQYAQPVFSSIMISARPTAGEYCFNARVIPYRGSWLDFEFDAKDIVNVRIDRRRKLPATTLLMALDSTATEKLRAKRVLDGKTLLPYEARGMSREEILHAFYVAYTVTRVKGKTKKDQDSWKTAFMPERMKGVKLVSDLIDAKTGKVAAEAGTKLTGRLARKLSEEGLKDYVVLPEELVGAYLAEDVIEEKNGLVLFEAGQELSQADIDKLVRHGHEEINLLYIDHANVGPYLRNTLAVNRST